MSRSPSIIKRRIMNSLIIACVATTTVCANVLKVEINKGWEFKQVRGVNWYPATVPGVVHTDLMSNQIIEDPFFRMNERACQWVDKEDWEYKTTFSVSDDVFSKDHIRMVFKGLDTYADVYLNDEKILAANNMFREWTVDCKGKLKKQGNKLVVYLHSPVKKDLPKYEALPYHYEASNDQSENGGLLNKRISIFARKAGYHYGWDWGPRLVTIGIWRPVFIEAWNDARIEDVQVFQENVSKESAKIRAVVEVSTSKDMKGVVSLSHAQNNQKYASVETDLKNGMNKVTVEFTLKNPRLWWSNGLGEQYLYPFKTALVVAGSEFDSKVTNIGIRSIRVVRENDQQGKSFYFELNGVPVFMKGANYIPCDNFVPRVSRERYEQVVLDAKNTNMNMLRVWGGGIYENDIFYDFCDKYGILIWHDFMFACSMYPADKEMLENIRQEAIQNVKRIRNHACLALWCGNNEINDAWFGWGWKPNYEKQSKEIADKIWGEYQAIFYKTLPDVVKEYDPQTFYWPSSPLSESGSGDMHFWRVWHAEAPITDYAKVIPQFMSEYGFQSFPEFGSVKKYAPEQRDWDIYSEVMLTHQRNNRGNQLINSYMQKDYRKPKDFRSFLYMSHLLQADAVRIGEEAHRRNMPRCMGSLYWQHNDCWPVASWSSTDYYGRWKALHYYTKRAFSEVLVSPFEEEGKLNVYVVSDRLSDIKANLNVRVMDLSGNVVFESTNQVTVPANTSKLFLTEPVEKILKGKSRNDVFVYAELREKDRTLSTNTYYLAKAKDIDFPRVTINRSIKKVKGGYEVKMKADKLARGVYLELDTTNNFFTDNYFDLLPGQAVTVKVDTSLAQAEFKKQMRIISIRDAY